MFDTPLFIEPNVSESDMPLTICGQTWSRWQWQDGIDVMQNPTSDDLRVIEEEGLAISRNDGWQLQEGHLYIRDAAVTLNGRTMPACAWLGIWSRQPTAEEMAILAAAGIDVIERITWSVYEPRDYYPE